MEVALRIGALAKRIRVFGVRAWMRASSTVVPGPARPIESVPICYEQAFGGTDPDAPAGKSTRSGQNPVGKGFTHRPADLLDTAAPQLEPIDGAPLRGGPFDVAPAGFGAIAPGWFPRARFAGTYDDAWKESRAPLLPRDFDERFYQVAPLDQQLPRPLPAGETIELFNLTPDGYLRLRTPDIQLQMRVIFRDGEERVGVTLHTVLLDPGRASRADGLARCPGVPRTRSQAAHGSSQLGRRPLIPVTVNINGLSVIHQGSDGIATATAPDVCLTPSPSGPIPIPYPNIAMSSDLTGGTTTVTIDGSPAAIQSEVRQEHRRRSRERGRRDERRLCPGGDVHLRSLRR